MSWKEKITKTYTSPGINYRCGNLSNNGESKSGHVTNLFDRFPDFDISPGVLNSKSKIINLANVSVQPSYDCYIIQALLTYMWLFFK